MCTIDQMLRASPISIRGTATIAHGSAGTQGNGSPDTHHIRAGIAATKTKKPRI